MPGAGCQKKSLAQGCACPSRACLAFSALHISPAPLSSARELLRTRAELEHLSSIRRALCQDVAILPSLPASAEPGLVHITQRRLALVSTG